MTITASENNDSTVDVFSSALSITHRHLLAVANTRFVEADSEAPLRVLDAGCGDGHFMAYLQRALPAFHPNRKVEVYGYDVADSKVQFDGYKDRTLAYLQSELPQVDWDNRLHLIRGDEAWPFETGFFDIVFSNQVGEHVADHEIFFAENARVLRDGGIAAHLFPLKHYIYEVHVRLPFVHRFHQWESKKAAIRILSQLGFGKYKAIKDKVSLDDFSTSYADFLTYYCNYLTTREVLAVCTRNGFRASFNHSTDFYTEKVREIAGRSPRTVYDRNKTGAALLPFVKLLASATLVLEKRDEYSNYIGRHFFGRDPQNDSH